MTLSLPKLYYFRTQNWQKCSIFNILFMGCKGFSYNLHQTYTLVGIRLQPCHTVTSCDEKKFNRCLEFQYLVCGDCVDIIFFSLNHNNKINYTSLKTNFLYFIFVSKNHYVCWAIAYLTFQLLPDFYLNFQPNLLCDLSWQIERLNMLALL